MTPAGSFARNPSVVNLLDGRPALDGRGFRLLYPALRSLEDA